MIDRTERINQEIEMLKVELMKRRNEIFDSALYNFFGYGSRELKTINLALDSIDFCSLFYINQDKKEKGCIDGES